MTGRKIPNAAGASIPEPSIFATNILSAVLDKNVIICSMTAEAVSFTISGKFFPLSGCVVMSCFLFINKSTETVIFVIPFTICNEKAENIKIDYEDLIPMLKDEKVSSAVKGVLVDLLADENNSYADTIEYYAKSCDSSELMRALQLKYNLRKVDTIWIKGYHILKSVSLFF